MDHGRVQENHPNTSRNRALTFLQSENGPVDTRRSRSKHVVVHTDRRSNFQVGRVQRKRIEGRSRPTATSKAQVLYCTSNESHYWDVCDPRRRARSEVLGSTDVIRRRDLESDASNLNARTASSHIGSSKTKLSCSSTQILLSCRSTLSVEIDGIKKQLSGAVSKESFKDLEGSDISDDNELLGSLIRKASNGNNEYDIAAFSGNGTRLFCSSPREGTRSKDEEGDQENESISDIDSQHEADLEENVLRRKANHGVTGREVYETECKKKGIIPASFLLARFTSPKVLMPHHGLGPKGGKALAKALMVNLHIKTLNLTDNDLRSIGGTSMAYMLYHNYCISDLDLSENRLDTSAGVAIAKTMVINETVRRLVLRGNTFNDKVAMAFSESLKENRRLSELDLGYNNFGEIGGLYLGAGLSLNYGLKVLSLKWNIIRGKGAVAIAHALAKNETLESLDLSWNSLGYKGALALSTNLLNNEELKHLDLRNNHLGEDAIHRLAPAFARHKNIQKIKLGQNPIGQEGVDAIFDAVVRNPRIRHIGLENISVPVKLVPLIEKLRMERDIVITVDNIPKSTATEQEKDGMDILIEFLNKTSLRLKDMFFRLDKDGSGEITRNEFKHGLRRMGILMNSKQLDKLIREIDWNENKRVDYREILRGHRNARLDKTRQAKALLEIRKKEQEALLLPEMDVIKRDLCSKRR